MRRIPYDAALNISLLASERKGGIVSAWNSFGIRLAMCGLAALLLSLHANAANERDGQHDFDLDIGTWKTELKRLAKPLSGSTTWVEYEGITVVRKVWGGRANLAELQARGSAGEIEALSLRLYNPEARQWSLNFSSSRSGTLSPPAIGEFKNGRGEFYSQETFNGRGILLRFVVIQVDDDTRRFEQSFSDDGGKNWELNWIAVDTRLKDDTSGGRGSSG